MNKITNLVLWLDENNCSYYTRNLMKFAANNELRFALKLNYEYVQKQLKTSDNKEISKALEEGAGFFSKEQLDAILADNLDFIKTNGFNPSFALSVEERAWLIISRMLSSHPNQNFIYDFIKSGRLGSGNMFKRMKDSGWSLDWYSDESYKKGFEVLNKLQEEWHQKLSKKVKKSEDFNHYQVVYTYDDLEFIYVPGSNESEPYNNSEEFENTSHDRIILGNKLGLCLGSTTKLYQDNENGEIYAICQNRNPVCAIRIKAYVEEARINQNKDLSTNLVLPLAEFLDNHINYKGIAPGAGIDSKENIIFLKNNENIPSCKKMLSFLVSENLRTLLDMSIETVSDLGQVNEVVDKENMFISNKFMKLGISDVIKYIGHISQDVILQLILDSELSRYSMESHRLAQFLINPSKEVLLKLYPAALSYLDTKYLQNNYIDESTQISLLKKNHNLLFSVKNPKPEVIKATIDDIFSKNDRYSTRSFFELFIARIGEKYFPREYIDKTIELNPNYIFEFSDLDINYYKNYVAMNQNGYAIILNKKPELANKLLETACLYHYDNVKYSDNDELNNRILKEHPAAILHLKNPTQEQSAFAIIKIPRVIQRGLMDKPNAERNILNAFEYADYKQCAAIIDNLSEYIKYTKEDCEDTLSHYGEYEAGNENVIVARKQLNTLPALEKLLNTLIGKMNNNEQTIETI